MLYLSILVQMFTISAGVIYHLNDTEYNRIPPLYTLDDYESCLRDQGVYCLAQFELYSASENKVINLIREYSAVTVKRNNHSIIDKGVCVSKSCDIVDNEEKNFRTKEGLHSALEECVNRTIWKEYGIHAKLRRIFGCDKQNDERPTDLLDWVTATICLVIIVINLIGTYYDYVKIKYDRTNYKSVYAYLSCFSLQKNISALIDKAQSSPESKCLQELHGIKTVATVLVLFAHVTSLVTSFTEDPHTFEKAYDNKFYAVIFSGLLLVQIFMFITGFLLAYSLQLKTEVGWRLVPKLFFLRWWRLTPPYALVLGVMMSWIRHLGTGPVWQMQIGSCVATCRKYWWSNVLYINNYIKENRFCGYQTWYIAADIQLFLLGLIVHVATRRRARCLVLGIVVLLGMAMPALHVWLYDLNPQAVLTPEFYRTLHDYTFESSHIQGHVNISCFIIGMATGYFAHNLQKRGTDLSRSKICKLLCWLVIPLNIGVFYHVSTVFADTPRAPLITRMLHAASPRTVLGVLYAIWTLGIICKCNDLSKALFSWRGWHVLSKLSYAVYLVHVPFIHVIFGLRKQLIPVSDSYVMSMTFLVLGLSFLAAVPLYLMVELPAERLMKLIYANQTRPKKN